MRGNLRHTFCSRLITNGINIKTVQVLMGHAHAETTMRIYANVTQSQNQEEMAVLEGKMRLRSCPVFLRTAVQEHGHWRAKRYRD